MTEADWREILEAYDLPGPVTISPAGGTATVKVLVTAPRGRFILRRRPVELARPERVACDHAWRTCLADAGFAAPRPIPSRQGPTWVTFRTQVYELSTALPGKMAPSPDGKQLFQAGRTLGQYHTLGQRFEHPGQRDVLREDHVSNLWPLLDQMLNLADTKRRAELDRLRRHLDDLAIQLDDATYRQLEQSVIHGDYHAGNLLFDGEQVSGVLDYDYASRQATLRDLGDGLMFLAVRHPRPFNPDDIWSLTQRWLIDPDGAMAFLRGYASVRPVPPQWPYLSSLMLSRWIGCKLRGARKVPERDKVRFVLTDLWDPIQLLSRHYQAWLKVLIDRI